MSNTLLVDELIGTEIKMSNRVKDTLIVIGASWVLALMAQISFPLPFSPVPITAQTFAVLIIGSSLGAKRAFSSTLLYLGQGAMGLPFFAGAKAGLGVLFGASSGYLLGFVIAATVMGYLSERKLERNLKTSLLIFLVGHAIIYMFGLVVLSFFVGADKVFLLGLFPFIPGLILKTFAASALMPSVWSFFKKG